jgi:ferric-dicitrate binding protein FerR (iron transport regulator)
MIDFNIIWKNIHNLATEEEKLELEIWMKEDQSHANYYKRIKKVYAKREYPQYYGPEVEKSWNNFKRKVINRKRNLNLIGISAIASILMLLWVIFKPGSNIPQIEIEAQNEFKEEVRIKPGNKKAILVLDDGTEYNLTDSSSFSLHEGNTKINRTGAAISYSKIHKKQGLKKQKYNTLKVPRGGEYFVLLSDSTKVWLNSETILRYPVEFIGGERIVNLEGEAYFEVKQNRKPFKVIADEQVVEVLGTSFNISSYKNDSLIFTTLVEGKVNVFLKENPTIKQTLLPNYQSYLYKNENMISVREVDPFPYIAWKEGRFHFKNKSLNEIMHTLSRWYAVDFIFEDENLASLKFTGDVKRYENLDKILALIQQTNELTYEFTDESTVIIR